MPEAGARSFGFAFTSSLDAPADVVWSHAIRLDGVNRELAPLARMTTPRAFASLDLEHAPLGERAFRSWILAFGFLPIDYDDLCSSSSSPAGASSSARAWRRSASGSTSAW